MIVFGDRSRVVRTGDRLDEIERLLGAAPATGAAAVRDRRVEALLSAGELAQGLADAAFAAAGRDEAPVSARAAERLCVAIAHLALGGGATAEAARAARALAALETPDEVQCRLAEGFAFYALYPEAYWATARSVGWSRPPLVIGLRSIGSCLAPVVAAAAGSRALVTARPVGPPFERRLELSARLRRRLRARGGPVAIVDEGPGLSGSSFAAAIELGEEVAPGEVWVLPSHAGGPGPQAGPDQRRLWRGARKAPALFDALTRAAPIGDWFEDLVGPASEVEDLCGGAWARSGGRAAAPVWAAQERRKYRLRTRQGPVLAKFAGLGATGRVKLERARALFDAGFSAEPLGLRRGFLVERWMEGTPLGAGAARDGSFVRRLGDYIAFRARAFPAPAGQGAHPAELAAMCSANAEELGGSALRARVARALAAARVDASKLRPIEVDARLQAWEWVRAANGRAMKTDALDHAAAHDLVGCQDVAWDLAGAAIEHGLGDAALAELAQQAAEARKAAVAPGALRFFGLCYVLFQAGLWTMAAAGAPPGDRPALDQRIGFCRAAIERVLGE